MHESGLPEHLASTVERVQQAAEVNLQLLVMLEVVHDWTRADAADLAEAAEQTESLTMTLGRSPEGQPEADALARANKAMAAVHAKLDRLTQLAPVQSRDSASIRATIEGLRRLRVASASLQAALDRSVVAPGTGSGPAVEGPPA